MYILLYRYYVHRGKKYCIYGGLVCRSVKELYAGIKVVTGFKGSPFVDLGDGCRQRGGVFKELYVGMQV